MKIKFLIVFIFLCKISTYHCMAQETKTIKRYIGDKRSNLKEVFAVLASNDSVKDGKYELFRNGNLVKSGFYRQGKKDSVWESYNRNGAVISSKTYHDGLRTGIWEFYTIDGKNSEWSYDFNTAKATIYQAKKADTSVLNYQDENGNWVRDNTQRGPIALRAQAEWQIYLLQNLHYPDDAINNKDQGMVTISIIVDENGNGIDYSVLRGATPSLDKEGLRTVKGFECEYVPAEVNGKKVKSKATEIVIFKLVSGR